MLIALLDNLVSILYFEFATRCSDGVVRIRIGANVKSTALGLRGAMQLQIIEHNSARQLATVESTWVLRVFFCGLRAVLSYDWRRSGSALNLRPDSEAFNCLFFVLVGDSYSVIMVLVHGSLGCRLVHVLWNVDSSYFLGIK